MIVWDDWQNDFLDCHQHKILVSGRQTGKSEIASFDALEFARLNPKTTTLIISKTERQAEELLNKALLFTNPAEVQKGKDKPTKSRIVLKNKARIISLPTGTSGEGVRGLTIHKLVVDEAQLVEDAIFAAVTPMLLTTGGTITLLGTPHGKEGYFWKAYENSLNHFKVFHINSVEAITNRPISESWTEARRAAALAHFEQEKARMSQKEFAQEYLGIFIDDLRQYFPDELIKAICILKRQAYPTQENNYMGCDIARLGGDESTFEIIHKSDRKYYHVENIVKKGLLTTETENKILELQKVWSCEKVGIDAGAGTLGVSIYDHLNQPDLLRGKIEAMNNRKIMLDKYGKKQQRIFKEDLYDNLRAMMERREIKLLDDDEVKASLKSVQWELVSEKNVISKVRIFGNYTHVAEGIIRAAYLAKEAKTLNISIQYIG